MYDFWINAFIAEIYQLFSLWSAMYVDGTSWGKLYMEMRWVITRLLGNPIQCLWSNNKQQFHGLPFGMRLWRSSTQGISTPSDDYAIPLESIAKRPRRDQWTWHTLNTVEYSHFYMRLSYKTHLSHSDSKQRSGMSNSRSAEGLEQRHQPLDRRTRSKQDINCRWSE